MNGGVWWQKDRTGRGAAALSGWSQTAKAILLHPEVRMGLSELRAGSSMRGWKARVSVSNAERRSTICFSFHYNGWLSKAMSNLKWPSAQLLHRLQLFSFSALATNEQTDENRFLTNLFVCVPPGARGEDVDCSRAPRAARLSHVSSRPATRERQCLLRGPWLWHHSGP